MLPGTHTLLGEMTNKVILKSCNTARKVVEAFLVALPV
jgi:hypothetical protein